MTCCTKCNGYKHVPSIDARGRLAFQRCDCWYEDYYHQRLGNLAYVEPRESNAFVTAVQDTMRKCSPLLLLGTRGEWAPYMSGFLMNLCRQVLHEKKKDLRFLMISGTELMDIMFGDRQQELEDGQDEPYSTSSEPTYRNISDLIEKPALMTVDLGNAQNNKRLGETLRYLLIDRQFHRKLTWVICPYEGDDLDKRFSRSESAPICEVLAGLPLIRIQNVVG